MKSYCEENKFNFDQFKYHYYQNKDNQTKNKIIEICVEAPNSNIVSVEMNNISIKADINIIRSIILGVD